MQTGLPFEVKESAIEKIKELLLEESEEDNQAKKPHPNPNSNVVHIKTDEEII